MDNEKESGGWNMYKLDDLFDFDGDGELDSVERMEMYQFMDNTANRDRNRFFEDDEGLNLFEDPEDEEDEWDEFEDEDEQDPFEDPDEDEWDEFEDEDDDEDSLIFADGTPQSLTLPAAGGEIDLAFSASGPWQAEITDGVEWIVLSQAAGEAGEHSLTVTVAENAAPVQRAAEITFTCGISAVTFSITQQAAEI